MNNNRTALIIGGVALAIIIIVGIVLAVVLPEKDKVAVEDGYETSACYLSSRQTDRGFSDTMWIKLNVDGNSVTGEIHVLPAEKDSKVGTFSGTLTAPFVDGFWNTMAEGMTATEELRLRIENSSARIGFGEMIDRGDGTYVYRDKNALTYSDPIPQVSCGDLDEKIAVENYVRNNIGSIAPNAASLGGSWYVISVNANPSKNSGHVVYEDGHTQEQADFVYAYSSGNVSAVEFSGVK
jgi:hypothetical protein